MEETESSTDEGRICQRCKISSKSGAASWLSFHWEEGLVGWLCSICKEGPDPLLQHVLDKMIEKRLNGLGVKRVFCKYCDATIFWVHTINDKPAPVDLNLVNHFATCLAMKKKK